MSKTAIITQHMGQFMPEAAVTAGHTHQAAKTTSSLETAAGQEQNCWKVLRNVSDFAALRQHSSLQEFLNEHQSKGD